MDQGLLRPAGVSIKPCLNDYTKKLSFLAANAIAFLDGATSPTGTERTFRDVNFINNVMRQRMLPETIVCASLHRHTRAMRRSITDIVTEYNTKHPV